MYDELINNLRSVQDDWQTEDEKWMLQAADAIEGLMRERDMYLEGMAKEHNKAARILWEKKHQWISVNERLPKEGEFVLVYGDLYPNIHDGGVMAISRRLDWNYWTGLGRERNITHWMPLPEPPKEEMT